MPQQSSFSADAIRSAVHAVQGLRPAYADLLRFYETIFILQEAARVCVRIEPVRIRQDLLSLRIREKLPVATPSEFTFDGASATDLLRKICQITPSLQTVGSAGRMATQAPALFESLLAGDDTRFQENAADLGGDLESLAFAAYHSLRPSLIRCAESLFIHVPSVEGWQKGYCPVCGRAPALALIEADGRRVFHCGFCWSPWPVKRVFCPFCEKEGGAHLHYLYSETEKELRVDVCDHCRTYIKTVDTRAAGRPVYPALEEVASLHLDMNARDRGYHPPPAPDGPGFSSRLPL